MPRITPERAHECEDKINNHFENARALLVELYEGEAWIVRGFANWREYMVAKFGYHESYLYRLLNAGLIERELSPNGEIGIIPESQLREVGMLDDPALRKAAWEAVQAEPKVTAQIVRRAVKAAADWANEYITTQGHTSLEGKSLEVAKAAITERMLENRQRQQQHIADSIDKRYQQVRLIDFLPVKAVRVFKTSQTIMFKLENSPDADNAMNAVSADMLNLRLSVAQRVEAKGDASVTADST